MNNSSFEKLRDYGISIIDYTPTYISTNSNEEVYIPKPDCNDVKDYRNSLKYMTKYLKGLNISFPKKLIPIQHPDDYNIVEDLSNDELLTFESDKLFNIYDYDLFETYADMSNNMISYFIDQYLLALSICKEYNIKNVVDIGCNCGIQSYIFNLNNINYKGIDAFKLNVFPFVLNKNFKVSFIHALYLDEYTEDYNSNNTMTISFNAYYALASSDEEQDIIVSNEEFIRLINDYKYIFLTIWDFYPYLYNLPVIKERIDKIITFTNDTIMEEIYNDLTLKEQKELYSNDYKLKDPKRINKDGYVLLIRKD